METAKTIDYLSEVTVLKQFAKINASKIIEYYVELDLTFLIDGERRPLYEGDE